ncbi:hypothetical protein L1987_64692 [Smallanthus sonchifolius]|uniref:Uncharacterized protein n=1 Tax=Smallanthus sonchifolius TaxID=185202 RepID=A0ACB9BSA5_9ASTR|nr:hypothetical protein L1987_64692 [Smallanthus sonchifolius]
MGFPLSYHVGLLGLSGLTAYVGLFEICKPKKGEKVFVSAASGSVGNLVGQYAKHFGCFVGCAGSPNKVKLLKEELGFDEVFNYKEENDLNSTLRRYLPDGIDIYFDNVGGEMLEAAISNMNSHNRVALCGIISEYTNAEKCATPDLLTVIYKRITIKGSYLVITCIYFLSLSPLLSITFVRARCMCLKMSRSVWKVFLRLLLGSFEVTVLGRGLFKFLKINNINTSLLDF